MSQSIKVIDDTAAEPVSVEEVKKFLEIARNNRAHDDFLEDMIEAAREYIEDVKGRSILAKDIEVYFNRFPSGNTPIVIPFPPLRSVTEIAYTDSNGDSATFASENYTVLSNREPAEIWLAPNQCWPSTYLQQDAVKVTCKVGYVTVPRRIQLTVKYLAAHWFENRESIGSGREIPMTATHLVNSLDSGTEFDDFQIG